MDDYGIACEILKQISEALSIESKTIIILNSTGNSYWMEKGFSIGFVDVDIPSELISVPDPRYLNDKYGFYRVNQIRLGRTIIDDTSKGFPFNHEEIMKIIKGNGTWAYYNINRRL